MARPIKKIDEQEVDEILQLKTKDLNGVLSKLTYNNVWIFNKELCEKQCIRSNGKPFNLYGYAFWATIYKGEPYLGRKKIDELKSKSPIIIAGESFSISEADITSLVKKHKNNTANLAEQLIKIFTKDQKTINSLKKENADMNLLIKALRTKNEHLEKAFYTLFYNSQFSNNSLQNIFNSSEEADLLLKKELKNIYDLTNNPLFCEPDKPTVNKKVFSLSELKSKL